MSSNKKTKNWKRVAFVIVLAAAAALAVPFLPGSLTGVFAQTEMNAGETDAETQTASEPDRPVTVEVTRALSRDILRAAVFLWKTPLVTPRISSGWASRRAASAADLSPEAMASSTLRR